MMDRIIEFVDEYNQNTRLKSLGYKIPFQYLKELKNIELKLLKKENEVIIHRIVN